MTKEQKKLYYDTFKRALELRFPILINYNNTIKQEDLDRVVNEFIKTVSGELPDTELDSRIQALITLVNDNAVKLKAYSDNEDSKIKEILNTLQAKVDEIDNDTTGATKSYVDNKIEEVKQWVIDRENENTPTDDEINSALA